MRSIEDVRKDISAIDVKIRDLFIERLNLIQEIKEIKIATSYPFVDSRREEEMKSATPEKQDPANQLANFNKQVVERWLRKSKVKGAKVLTTSAGFARVGLQEKCKFVTFEIFCARHHRSHRLMISRIDCSSTIASDSKLEIAGCKLFAYFVNHLSEIEKELVESREAKKLHAAYVKLMKQQLAKAM